MDTPVLMTAFMDLPESYRSIVYGLLLLPALLVPVKPEAQVLLSGRVIDAGTQTPIPLCHVYVSGSSIGSNTDTTGFFRLELPGPGAYQVVFSHISYEPRLIDVIAGTTEKKLPPVRLREEVKNMEEVTVETQVNKKWKRQYTRFIRYIMGTHYNKKEVEILNSHVVEFKDDLKGVLIEDQPFNLEIINRFSGYRINFLISRFYISNSNQFMTGYPGFQALTSDDPKEQKKWEENRAKAYRGSLRHFFKSLLENTLESNGFRCYLTEKDPERQVSTASKILPVDELMAQDLRPLSVSEAFAIEDTEDPNIKKITFKKIMDIYYTDHVSGYGKRQRAMLKPYEDHVYVYTNGMIVDPTTVKVFGYLARRGVYEMLPFDYQLKN